MSVTPSPADCLNGEPPWAKCIEAGCVGVCLDGAQECLAHCVDDTLVDRALAVVAKGRLDVRGVPVSAELLQEILAKAPKNAKGAAAFTSVRAERATFQGPVNLNGADLGRAASFRCARFEDDAVFIDISFGPNASSSEPDFTGAVFAAVWFDHAVLGDRACFIKTTFAGRAEFTSARFGCSSSFDNARFESGANFDDAIFDSDCRLGANFLGAPSSFQRVRFGDRAVFDNAVFADDVRFFKGRIGESVSFRGTVFGARAVIEALSFEKEAMFSSVVFGDGARFSQLTFGDSSRIGPAVIEGTAFFTEIVFGRDPAFQIAAVGLVFSSLKFPYGASFKFRWAEIEFHWVDIAQSSIFTLAPPIQSLSDGEARLAQLMGTASGAESPGQRVPASAPRTSNPRLVALRETDVQHLIVSHTDLRACHFAESYGLDKLILDRSVHFSGSPGLRAGWSIPPIWRWTSRQTLAEEHEWRAHAGYRKRGGWDQEACRATLWEMSSLPAPQVREPHEIAELYRALRKSREDRKDEPGAADFYYGEMEMRRKSVTTGLPERFILWWYWILSGYGMRALRALIALAVIVTLFSGLFNAYGFADVRDPFVVTGQQTVTRPPVPSLRWQDQLRQDLREIRRLSTWTSFDAWVYSAGVATSIITAPEAQLTSKGRFFRVILRIIGPLLLGLAVLSIRGRIKR